MSTQTFSPARPSGKRQGPESRGLRRAESRWLRPIDTSGGPEGQLAMSDQQLIGKSTGFKGDLIGVSYRAATPHTFLERRYSTAALLGLNRHGTLPRCPDQPHHRMTVRSREHGRSANRDCRIRSAGMCAAAAAGSAALCDQRCTWTRPASAQQRPRGMPGCHRHEPTRRGQTSR
jgi:hypothetical protein